MHAHAQVRAAIRRRAPGDAERAAALTMMLARVALANHLAQRREFTSADVASALAGSPDEMGLWRALAAEEEAVPLIKTLELGTSDADAAAAAAAAAPAGSDGAELPDEITTNLTK